MIGSFKLNTAPLVYMAPRGLISILLFLQIDKISFPFVRSEWIDERTLLVVILLSMVVLILGNNTAKKADTLKLDQDELLSPTVEFPLRDSQESNETTNE